MCLLHSLWKVSQSLDIQVVAAHYNHHLRGEESERDARFVRELAEALGVELISGEGDVSGRAEKNTCGIEETAREMRYAFLQEAARKAGAEVIATAHNANDNAETLLMHLLRGTGTRGLAGIPPVRGNIVRPLLAVSREEIEAYLLRWGLSHVEDSSNREDAYTRNRIRHQLFPVLEELSPGIVAHLNRTAEHVRTDEEYLCREAEKLALQAERKGDTLYIRAALLGENHPAVSVRAARILMGKLREGNDNCTSVHLTQLLELCRGRKASGTCRLPGGIFVRREYDRVLFTTQMSIPIAGYHPLRLPGETQVGAYRLICRSCRYQGEQHLPGHFFLSGRYKEMYVRARRTGDMLCRPGRKRKLLKKLLIDEKIPLQRRDSLPVLDISGRAAAAAELGPDVAFLPQPGEICWEIIITESENLQEGL